MLRETAEPVCQLLPVVPDYSVALLWLVCEQLINFKTNIMAPQNDDSVNIKKTDNTFDLFYESKKVGFMDYNNDKEGILEITHTEVDSELGGKGFGTELVKAAVEDARKNDMKILSPCPYAKKVIEKTPEFKDVLSS